MPKYGLSLVHICPHMDRIRSVFYRIWTKTLTLAKYGKVRVRESLYFDISCAMINFSIIK